MGHRGNAQRFVCEHRPADLAHDSFNRLRRPIHLAMAHAAKKVVNRYSGLIFAVEGVRETAIRPNHHCPGGFIVASADTCIAEFLPPYVRT